MLIKPVKRYRPPGYPAQDVLRRHPELLRLLPRRWRDAPLVVSALSLACLVLAARDGVAADSAGKGAEDGARPPAQAARVAPIFHHGTGRGAFGCVSVAAPYLLSEDEARQVIVEEAATAGIHFTTPGKTLADVERPVTGGSSLMLDRRTMAPKTRRDRLALDGTDAARNVSFEFVSGRDLDSWSLEDYQNPSSVSRYDNLAAAEVLREGLARTGADAVVGVFYDPVSYYDYLYRDYGENREKAEAKEQAVEALKRQVADFIAWLKAQGIV